MGADGCFTCASQTFRTLFGIGLMEDIASLAMADFYPDPVPQGEVDVLLARDGFWRIERTAVLRDGTQFPHWFSLSRRALGGYLCIVHDISSRLKMEAEHAFLLEELQIAQRRDAIAELATGVAHDLNNLVGVVDGTADLIEMQATGNSAILAGTQRIKRATGMARELVSNLGRLDRPDSPRATLDLRVLAKQVYGLLGSTRISDHSIKIIVPEMPISILANATDVQQVLVNLAINACDAKEGATNVVNMAVLPKDAGPPSFAPSIGMMYPDKQYAFVVVSDTGNGIMPELREKLFTRYFTTKGDKGTGLGLPIVATILRENDAVLWLDTTPGVGTVVTIGWPLGLVDLSTNEPRGAGPSFDGSELSGARILVVDDVADMGQVLAEMLGAAGATTVRIDDAAKALELISDEAEHWSALVTDLDMPGLSGFDLAIAAAKRNPPLPVVLVTALVESVGRRKDQFSSILQKPTKAERLIDAVRKVISSR
jgi:signal transduction histidine kinase